MTAGTTDPSGCFVHPSAIVEEGAVIGPGTRVWHFTHICKGAVIGSRVTIGQNCYIAPTVKVGDGCKMQNNISLYDGVILEDDVFCGPSMVFTNVRNPRAHVSRRHEYAQTRVKRGATIGANATIVCGVTLGRYCFIGAGAVVLHDVPDFALWVGNPARHVGWMCRCGERLSDDYHCGRCGGEYSLQSGRLVERVESKK